MRFFENRKIKALQKIFPNGTITTETLVAKNDEYGLPTGLKKTLYVVADPTLEILSMEQTKTIEKKRLRISSIDFVSRKITLQRKFKVFDWFLVYTALRICFGAITLYLAGQL